MVSIAILGHKETKKRKIVNNLMKFLKEGAKDDEYNVIYISSELKKDNQIITDKILYSIKENSDGEISDICLVSLFNDNLERSIIRLGNILFINVFDKIVLIFTKSINIDVQFEFFKGYFEYLPKYVYVFLDEWYSNEIVEVKKNLKERLKSKNIEVRRFFDLNPNPEFMSKNELEKGFTPEQIEVLKEKIKDSGMWATIYALNDIATDVIFDCKKVEIEGRIEDVEFHNGYGVYVSSETGEITPYKEPKFYLWNYLVTVDKLIEKKPIMDWIDTLPFPLASILWLYVSDINIEHKINHLFKFFEAYSEFMVMIILNAFKNDESFFNQEKEKWIEKDPKYKNWIKKPTFGTWNIMGRKLSKIIRKYLHNKEKKQYYLDLLRLSETFLDMISNKRIFFILEQVANLRNLWIGHGGVANLQELENRLEQLEKRLDELRMIITTHFSDILLILPGSNLRSGDMFNHQVKCIMGTRTPFKVIGIQTLEAMDIKFLYIIHKDFKKPIKIKFPFIKMMDTLIGEKNAVYFFNRIEGDVARYVSYIYGQNGEKFVSSKELEELL